MNTITPRATRTLFIASIVLIVLSLAASAFSVTRVLSAPLAAVTVPNKVGFEGFIANADGSPLADGAYSITFAVYDVATGGTALWSETQSSVQVTKGLYAVHLGSGTALPANLFNGERWIGVKVGSDPWMTPRTKVSSVPFALNAESANNADMVDNYHAAFSGANPRVLATDGSGNAIIGNLRLWNSDPGNVPGIYTNGGATYINSIAGDWVTAGYARGNGLLVGGGGGSGNLNVYGQTYMAGNVGIGTPGPSETLDVNGSIRAAGVRKFQTTRTINGTAVNDWVNIGSINNTGAGTYSRIRIWAHFNNNLFIREFEVYTTYYTGATTGWVELPPMNGTDWNDSQNFAVDARYASHGGPIELRLRRLSGGGWSGTITVEIETNSTFTADTTNGTAGTVAAGYLGRLNGWKFPATTNHFSSTTNGLYITGAGNVGIGTTGPDTKLRVEGNDSYNWTTLIYNTANNSGLWAAHGLGYGAYIDAGNNASASTYAFNLHAGGTSRFYVRGDGNVGIGTTSPSQKLSVAGNVAPTAANSYDLGTSALYWGTVHYHTLSSHSVGVFDKGVKLRDGRTVSCLDALQSLKPMTSKQMENGLPHLDYATLPEAVYRPAEDSVVVESVTTTVKPLGIAYTQVYTGDNGTMTYSYSVTKTLKGEPSADLDAMISLIMCAANEVNTNNAALEQRVAALEKAIKTVSKP